MEPVLKLRAAVALLGQFPVLAGIDLEVSDGERVLLEGPNGAGKTSLLRTCAGLIPVTSGTALVLSCDLATDRRSVRPLVGLLAHTTGLYDDLTPVENIRFWADACRADPDDAVAAMDRVALATRLRSIPTSRLSTGQRRRVSLAAMIVRRPRLWLLDEPHAGLDADGRDLIDSLIGEAAASGATVLFASHDLDRATSVASRVVTIAGGVVTADTAAALPSGRPEGPGHVA